MNFELPTGDAIPISFAPETRMTTTQKHLCRLVSFLGIACALFCFWYIVSIALFIFGTPPRADRPDDFLAWYVSLTSVAFLIAIGTAFGSIELARLRFRGVKILTIFSLLPIPISVIVGMLWLSPMGTSIASATGVSLGGLVPLEFSLLPVWSGLLWIFAFRSNRTT
jgi:hypothetical protein